MSQNLYDAHRQWARRPYDERFADLHALQNYVQSRRSGSTEQHDQLKYLHVIADESGMLLLNGHSEPAVLTHWSFGQFCTWIGSPAGYLRSLPAELTVRCLEESGRGYNASCQLLRRNSHNGGESSERAQLAALTGPRYSRIWDDEVLGTIIEATADSPWKLPPARPSKGPEASGLYASDRDMFIFLINEEQTVEVEGVRLGRGFFCWNSETGAASFGLTTFLYNYVCANHIVWGAERVSDVRIIHRDNASVRFRDDVLPALQAFVQSGQNNALVTDTVARAMKEPVGADLDEVLKWAQGRPFSQREIKDAWEIGEAEGENTSTLWGLVQGLSASARRIPYTNIRVNLEKRAGQLLKLAA
jgi:hypothetical protein